ncbi:pilus assembly protein [Naasia lichenicola]|uniref:Pilus assembly protein n=1 Tax=Naasia lichenicola TaxID=2565933 RepID=A0A4S4FFA0_9MICO|nr:pilus assembly protein [Naasia lichenicola]
MRDETGSAPAEFVLVSAMLCFLALSVIQLGVALHVRNTITDAAAEGARIAALADAVPGDGELRTRQLIALALGDGYPVTVAVGQTEWLGHPATEVRVTGALPVIALLGVSEGLEVTGHAAVEEVPE